MRSLILLFLAVGTVVLAAKRDDDDDGIPRVEDAKDPACVPWYEIRDVIMGDIFHGECSSERFKGVLTPRAGRCNDLSRAAIRLAFHDAGKHQHTHTLNHSLTRHSPVFARSPSCRPSQRRRRRVYHRRPRRG